MHLMKGILRAAQLASLHRSAERFHTLIPTLRRLRSVLIIVDILADVQWLLELRESCDVELKAASVEFRFSLNDLKSSSQIDIPQPSFQFRLIDLSRIGYDRQERLTMLCRSKASGLPAANGPG
jgi:hypothetical protein